MRNYIAIAEPSDDGKTWWISFPGFPGVTSAADRPEEIARRAQDALTSAIEAGVTLPPGASYNKYFAGHSIAMPPPLSDKRVDYTDGSPMTVEQYSKDISAFLMWAAEPTLEARKRIGFQVLIFLIVFAGLLYFTKKKVWHAVELHPGKL